MKILKNEMKRQTESKHPNNDISIKSNKKKTTHKNNTHTHTHNQIGHMRKYHYCAY